MLNRLVTVPLAAAAMLFAASSVAQTQPVPEAKPDAGHKFLLAGRYYAQCQNVNPGDFQAIRPRLKAFTDVEIMAGMLADPAETARLAEVVFDPRTLHVMMRCAMEPVMWETWMRNMTDFPKMMRAASHFMDPATYMRWMAAPTNPEVLAALGRMSSPATQQRWATAMANPTFYQPMFSFMDPAFIATRMQWMMNPASYYPMMQNFGVPAPTPQAN